MWEVRVPRSDHKPASLLPRRDPENLSTVWSYAETVESLVRHEYHRSGKEVRQHQWSWAKECVPFIYTCVPGVAARQYRMAWKGKPDAVCAVSACEP
jgi:hypothetical protein